MQILWSCFTIIIFCQYGCFVYTYAIFFIFLVYNAVYQKIYILKNIFTGAKILIWMFLRPSYSCKKLNFITCQVQVCNDGVCVFFFSAAILFELVFFEEKWKRKKSEENVYSKCLFMFYAVLITWYLMQFAWANNILTKQFFFWFCIAVFGFYWVNNVIFLCLKR